MKGKVLFTDTVHPALQFQLEQHGFACVDGTTWTKELTEEKITEFTGIVIRSRFKLDAPFLQKATSLKFIARAGAGMENIDTDAARSLGIICINAPEGNRNAVAEHAMGMLLALMNNIVPADREVRNGEWYREENRGVELMEKTVGIVGFGNTGSMFAKKLSGFDVQILAYDPYKTITTHGYPYVKQSGMDALFSECDVISFHVPLTTETQFMVNDRYISNFSKPVYLLNTSRGKVVETQALANGLENGHLKGVALDVLEFESLSFEQLSNDQLPPAFKKLLNFRNVILSPHVAGWSVESHRKISEVLAKKIIDLNW